MLGSTARTALRFLGIQSQKLHPNISNLRFYTPFRAIPLLNSPQNKQEASFTPSKGSNFQRSHIFICSASMSSSPPASNSSLDPSRQVKVSHILLPTGQESQIEELKSKILNGEATLATLAAELSTCPSRSQGGDIGWMPRGRTVPEFEAAAYATPKGGLSTCTTKFGVHLVQVTDERVAVDVGHCSIHELGELLATAAMDASTLDDIQFIDVREPWEVDMASIAQFKQNILPLSSFQEWAPRVSSILDPSKETLVLCHHGVRSMQAANFLVENGFKNVRNVTGGIDAYSRGVDPNITLY